MQVYRRVLKRLRRFLDNGPYESDKVRASLVLFEHKFLYGVP